MLRISFYDNVKGLVDNRKEIPYLRNGHIINGLNIGSTDNFGFVVSICLISFNRANIFVRKFLPKCNPNPPKHQK